MPLIDLEKPTGHNTAGITATIYYQLADNVETFPAPAGTDMGALAVLASDIVLAPGNVWKQLYCTLETGSVQSEMVGERDGRCFRNTLTISHPGNSPEILGFLEYVKNSRLICIARDIDGQYRLVGSKFLPATLKAATAGTGNTIDSRKAALIEIEALGRIAPIYEGAIQLVLEGNDYIDDDYIEDYYE